MSGKWAVWACVGLLFGGSGAGAETFRIDQPNVTQAKTDYPHVHFAPGDIVSVIAGGCVQTGGHGATWKRYVNPSGTDSNRLYHGLIWIPGATDGFVRIQSVLGRTLEVRKGSESDGYFLRLGYEDDGYGDNGYWGRDPGTENQCVGEPDAFVVVTVTHPEPPSTPVQPHDDTSPNPTGGPSRTTEHSSGKPGFFETVPGLITAIAGLITALTGMVALFIHSRRK